MYPPNVLGGGIHLLSSHFQNHSDAHASPQCSGTVDATEGIPASKFQNIQASLQDSTREALLHCSHSQQLVHGTIQQNEMGKKAVLVYLAICRLKLGQIN